MSQVKVTHAAATTPAVPQPADLESQLEAVRRRAYELFLSRGATERTALDDWFDAEKEVLGWGAVPIAENEGAYEVDFTLPGFSAKDIEVTSSENEVIVYACATAARNEEEDGIAWNEYRANEVYRRFPWPTPVSMERISAELRDGVLHVHAPKSITANGTSRELAPA
jgi:HSP20 family molecular chaperone IbpA